MAKKNKKVEQTWPEGNQPTDDGVSDINEVEDISNVEKTPKINPSGDFYTQCRLVKKIGKDSTAEQISFIPSEFAVRNTFVKVKDLNGEWSDGWEVISIGMRLPKDQLQVYRDVYRHTRDASDA